MSIVCPNKNDKLYKDLAKNLGDTGAYHAFSLNNNSLPDYKSYPEYNSLEDKYGEKIAFRTILNNIQKSKDEVDYLFKSINVITNNLNKISKWESNKAINEKTLWSKIQQLGVPKNQIELIKESKGKTVGEKITSFASDYNYSVKIDIKNSNSSYSNLTVPGGTNYIESEIYTPLITPVIKGHADFSTSNGIGWFRSDDKRENLGKTKELGLSDLSDDISDNFKTKEVLTPTKTRRILEVQSDLFQKGRNKDFLIDKSKIAPGQKYFDLNLQLEYEIIEFKESVEEFDMPGLPNLLLVKYEDGSTKTIIDELGSEVDTFLEKSISSKNAEIIQKSKNNFLQLLNKDNNWVTFFVKSIIQDSAKKGYSKVLFPKGDTSIKIESSSEYETINDAKIAKEENLVNAANFYEKTIFNVLKKQFGKKNVSSFVDENGNKWNEITIDVKRDLDSILFNLKDIPTTKETRFDKNPITSEDNSYYDNLTSNATQATQDNTQAESFLKERFPDAPIEFYEDVKQVGSQVAHGYLRNGAFYLWNNAEIGTAYHEAFHGMTQMYFNNTRRNSLYNSIAEEYNLDRNDELALEEKGAELFQEYMLLQEQSSFSDTIKNLFKSLYYYIKAIVTNSTSIDQAFTMLQTNRFPPVMKRNLKRFRPDTTLYSLKTNETESYQKDITNGLYSIFEGVYSVESELSPLEAIDKIRDYLYENAFSDADGNSIDVDIANELLELKRTDIEEYENRLEQYDIYEIPSEEASKHIPIHLKTDDKLDNLYNLYIEIAENWESRSEDETGNFISTGWKNRFIDALPDFGKKLTDYEDTVNQDEKIYDKSNLEENRFDKMSGRVKNFLSNINSNELSILGQPKKIEVRKVYNTIIQHAHDKDSLKEVIEELENISQYKPFLKQVVEELNDADPILQAEFMNQIRQTYTKLYIFVEFTDGVRIFEANSTNLTNIIIDQWITDAIKPKGLTGNNLYILENTEDTEQYSLRQENVDQIEEAYQEIMDYFSSNDDTLSFVPSLAKMLKALGMFQGQPLETFLNDYFSKKHKIGKDSFTGRVLFRKLFREKGDSSQINDIISKIFTINKNNGTVRLTPKENIKPYFQDSKISSFLKKRIAPIQKAYDIEQVQSFLSGENKSVFPYNLPTQLSDTIKNIQQGKFYTFEMDSNPMISPLNDKRADSLAKQLFTSEFKEEVDWMKYDVSKKNKGEATQNYRDQGADAALTSRIHAFLNNGRTDVTWIPIPTQSGRDFMGYVKVPMLKELAKYGVKTSTLRSIIKQQFISQYLQMQNAQEYVDTVDEKYWIPNFHYKEVKKDGKKVKDTSLGSAFKPSGMFEKLDWPDIINSEEFKELNLSKNSDYVQLRSNNILNSIVTEFENQINERIETTSRSIIDDWITNDIIPRNNEGEYIDKKGNVVQTPDAANHPFVKHVGNSKKYTSLEALVKDYVLHHRVYENMLTEVFYNNRGFFKNYDNFTKRAGLLTTPGLKPVVKGSLSNNEEVGLPSKVPNIIFKDILNHSDDNNVYDWLESMGVPWADQYKAGASNKTDAGGFMSIHGFKDFAQAFPAVMPWTESHEQAYRNYNSIDENGNYGLFLDDNGNMPYIPAIKPSYFANHTIKHGSGTLTIPLSIKNSYFVLLREMTNENGSPLKRFDNLRKRMEAEGEYSNLDRVDWANPDSALKVFQQGIVDLDADNLSDVQIHYVESKNLRIPQIKPEPKSSKILLASQLYRLILTVSNLPKDTTYKLRTGKKLKRDDFVKEYHRIVSTMIVNSIDKLKRQLRYEAFLNGENIAENSLALHKKVRDIIVQSAKDNGTPLSENQLKMFDIEYRDGSYQFKTPLGFPVFAKKNEQQLNSIFKNRALQQRIHGKQAVQIAELGNVEVDGKENNLKFITIKGDVKNAKIDEIVEAEIAVSADIAAKFGLKEGDDLSKVSDEVKTLVGYRIPTSGKSLMLPMRIKRILPGNYRGVVMVPGRITTQMGSDFDIDTLFLYIPNTEKVRGKLRRRRYIDVDTNNEKQLKKVYDYKYAEHNEWIKSLPKFYNTFITNITNRTELFNQMKDLIQPYIMEDLDLFDTLETVNLLERNYGITKLSEIVDMFNIPSESSFIKRYKGVDTVELNDSKQLENRYIELVESVLLNPDHALEMLQPTEGDTFDAKVKEEEAKQSDLDPNDPRTSISLQIRNRDGKGGIGIWSNNLMLYSTLQNKGIKLTSPIGIKRSSIDDSIIYLDTLFKEKDIEGNSIEDNIKARQIAAIDNENEPVMAFINDNAFTSPATIALLNAGLDQDRVVNFMTSNTIRKLTDIYERLGGVPYLLGEAILEVNPSFNFDVSKVPIIDYDNLPKNSQDISLLQAFYLLTNLGRDINKLGKVVTPNRISDMSSQAAISEYMQHEQYINKEQESFTISGDSSNLVDALDDMFPSNRAYRMAIRETAKFSKVFFPYYENKIESSLEDIKHVVGSTNLTKDTIKSFYDFSYAYMVLQNRQHEEGFSDYLNELIFSDKNSVVEQVINLKETDAEFANNIFISALNRNRNNNKSIFKTFSFNFSSDYGKNEVDVFVNSFQKLYDNPKYNDIAKKLIDYAVYTTGFANAPNSFIKLIPESIWRQEGYVKEYISSNEKLKVNDNIEFSTLVDNFLKHNIQSKGLFRTIDIKNPNGQSTFPNKINITNEDIVSKGLVYKESVIPFRVYDKKRQKYILYAPSSESRSGMVFDLIKPKGHPYQLIELGDVKDVHPENNFGIDYSLSSPRERMNVENNEQQVFTKIAQTIHHSGGANGSDLVWDTIGKEYGKGESNHYFTGERTNENAPGGNVDITDKPIALEGAIKVAQAAKNLWGYKYNKMKDQRLIRNWAQVKNSDAIFAIGELGKLGDVWKKDIDKENPRKLLKIAVQGGTGYAVEMAIIEGKPVYLFDQKRNQWYKNTNGEWSKSEVPILTQSFAGIGTGEINENGKQAIRDVYEKTQKELSTNSASTVQNENIQFYEGDITPDDDTILAFGSNLNGKHGAGAAKIAKDKFGAIYGQGEGLQGNAFAIPTKDLSKSKQLGLYSPSQIKTFMETKVISYYKNNPFTDVVNNNPFERSVSPQQIITSIQKLYKQAEVNPNKKFKVAYREGLFGYSLNGYLHGEMIEMFNAAGTIPSNVIFSKEWFDTGKLNLNTSTVQNTSSNITQISYTPKGKNRQTYTVKGNKIFNKDGKEVFKEDSVDRNRIFANLAVKQGRATIVEHNNNSYLVNNKKQIMSVKTGKIMQWGDENGNRVAILDKANKNNNDWQQRERQINHTKETKLASIFGNLGFNVTTIINPQLDSLGSVNVNGNNITVTLKSSDLVQSETYIHEFGHVLIEMMGYEHPTVKEGIRQLKKTNSDLWSEIQELYNDESLQTQEIELLVTAIGEEGVKILNQPWYKAWWNRFLNAIKSLFGVEKLIANQLANQMLKADMQPLNGNWFLHDRTLQHREAKKDERSRRLIQDLVKELNTQINNIKQLVADPKKDTVEKENLKKELETKLKHRLDVEGEIKAVQDFIQSAHNDFSRIHHLIHQVKLGNNVPNAMKRFGTAFKLLEDYKSLTQIRKEINNIEHFKNSGLTKKIRNVIELKQDIEDSVLDTVIPLMASELREKVSPDVEKQLEEMKNQIDNGYFPNRTELNKSVEYRKLKDEAILLKEQGKFDQDVYDKKEKELAKTLLEKRVPSQKMMEDLLKEAHNGNRYALWMLDPLVYSDDQALQLFSILVKDKLSDARDEMLSHRNDIVNLFENFKEEVGSPQWDISKFYENIVEDITVYKEGGETMQRKSFINPIDVSRWKNKRYKFYSELNKRYKVGKDIKAWENANTKLVGKRKKEIIEWYRLNTNPVNNWKKIRDEKWAEFLSVKKRAKELTEENASSLAAINMRVRQNELELWLEDNFVDIDRDYNPSSNSFEEIKEALPEIPKNTLVRPSLGETVGKETKNDYTNERYTWLQQPENKAYKDYHDGLLNKFFEYQDAMDVDNFDKEPWEEYSYFVPSVRKSMLDRTVEDGALASGKEFFEDLGILETDTDYGEFMSENKRIPVFYANAVDSKDVSNNLASIMDIMGRQASRYKKLKELVGHVFVMRGILENRKIPKQDSSGNTMKDMASRLVGFDRKAYDDTPASQTKHVKQFNDWTEKIFFGNNTDIQTIRVGNKEGELNKFAQKINSASAFSVFPFNFFQGISNVLHGNILIVEEAVAGNIFTKKNYVKAQEILTRQALPLANDMGRDRPYSKLGQLIEMFDATEGVAFSSAGMNRFDNRLKNLTTLDRLMFLQQAGELQMALAPFLAAMDAYKIKHSQTGEEISLYNAYEIGEDGNLRLKEGYEFSKEEQNKFTNKINGLNRSLQGIYDEFNSVSLSRKWYGKLLLLFRSWMIPGFRRYWGFNDRDFRIDHEMGQIREGMFISFYKFLKEISVGQNKFTMDAYRTMSEYEQLNVKRSIVRVGTLAANMIFLSFLKAESEDEELSATHYYSLYYAHRLNSELQFFLRLDEAQKIMRSPAASMGLYNKVFQALQEVVKAPFSLAINGELEGYQRSVGIYEKNYPKVYARLRKLMPVLNSIDSFRSPEEAYKWYTQLSVFN